MAAEASPLSATDARPFDGRGLAALIGIGLLIGAAILFRDDLVILRPNLAGLYRLAGFEVNVRGLAFEGIDLIRDVQNGQAGLVVEGEIRNVTGKRVTIPSLRLALLGADGQELSTWTANVDRDDLAAGESVPFRTRVESPPDSAVKLVVRFGDGSR